MRAFMTLKVYDCYRPQRAVDSFIEWAKDPDMSTQPVYYPHYTNKEELFREGYIATKVSISIVIELT